MSIIKFVKSVYISIGPVYKLHNARHTVYLSIAGDDAREVTIASYSMLAGNDAVAVKVDSETESVFLLPSRGLLVQNVSQVRQSALRGGYVLLSPGAAATLGVKY